MTSKGLAGPARTTRCVAGLLLWLALFSGGCGASRSFFAMNARSVAKSDSPYADRLVRLAEDQRLGRSKLWLRLGHYRADPFDDHYQSEVDAPRFFLSPDGKFSPEAELEATLRALLAPPASEDAAGRDAHVACRYPARTAWLVERLQIEAERIPVKRCERFGNFVTDVRPESATMVFASAYLNSPASAAGHTFLRLNKAGVSRFATSERRELLDYGIDYSATVTTTNPVVYAFMGMTGGFRGTFQTLPYYRKVREYNDLEARDLWEYELDLDGEALFRLVAHLWELDGIHFDYFYLTENCSYHILGLLEVARPDVDLIDGLKKPVVPSATVQALFAREGFVRGSKYRPSLRTQFWARLDDLSRDEKRAVDALAKDAAAPLPPSMDPARQALLLDAAVDLVDMRHGAELIKEREGPKAQLKQALLERRAQLRVASAPLALEGAELENPEGGHLAWRTSLGGGVERNGDGFGTLGFRSALHDLADRPTGYPEMAQIDFLQARLKLGKRDGRFKVRVDEAWLVRVLSIADLNQFEMDPTYKFAAGVRGLDDKGCHDCAVVAARLGGGGAKVWGGGRLALFLTLDADLLTGPALDGFGGYGIGLGAGPAAGFRFRITPDLVTLATAEWLAYPAQAEWYRLDTRLTVRWAFRPQYALSLEGRGDQRGVSGQGLLMFYL